MRRIKVALDANIPQRTVGMLNSGFRDQGYEFHWEPSFASSSAEDEFWAAAFTRFGGQVVLTGDKNIARRPHQIAAFREHGLIGFYCARTWAQSDLAYKSAHLIRWWPTIHEMIAEAKPGDAWWVPMGLRGEFKKVENAGTVRKRQKKAI
ncbi:MAG: hypothetical protein P1U37_06575 [Minwuia sp.]|nr:hypothetical protein [Minwuia sp.]